MTGKMQLVPLELNKVHRLRTDGPTDQRTNGPAMTGPAKRPGMRARVAQLAWLTRLRVTILSVKA